MPTTADVSASGCLAALLSYAVQGLIIWFIVIVVSKRRKKNRQTNRFVSSSISPIAQQWPDDEEYLTKLCTPILAVPFTEGDYTSYATSIRQHKVSLRYFHHSNPKIFHISFAVTQKFWLRIMPQTGDDLPDEVRVEDKLIDEKFRIHSDKQQLAHRFFNSPIVVKELKDLHPFYSFEINKGKATYVLHNPRDTGFLHHAFQLTLSRLSNIIDVYEQQKLDLFVEVLHTESNICPYCREDLNAQQERIVKCNLCQTAHHESCFTENQQCTTWGCLATAKDFTVMMDGHRTTQEFETN